MSNQVKTEKAKRQLKVRLAQNQYEIEKTLSLRYDIFNLEMQQGLAASHATRKDRDKFDLYCDHLIVVDEGRDNMIVGTYRVLRSSVARKHEGFYSEGEFSLRGIYDLKDEVVEIGRSCVHPEYRDGSVISHLWIGLGMYLREYNARYLCGCGSIHSHDAETANLVYAYLREKEYLVEPGFDAIPHPEYRLAGFRKDVVIDDLKAVGKQMPPLIKGYMRAGARITGEPAYDHEFGTTDFFIIFDEAEVDKRYGRHYLETDLSLKHQ